MDKTSRRVFIDRILGVVAESYGLDAKHNFDRGRRKWTATPRPSATDVSTGENLPLIEQVFDTRLNPILHAAVARQSALGVSRELHGTFREALDEQQLAQWDSHVDELGSIMSEQMSHGVRTGENRAISALLWDHREFESEQEGPYVTKKFDELDVLSKSSIGQQLLRSYLVHAPFPRRVFRSHVIPLLDDLRELLEIEGPQAVPPQPGVMDLAELSILMGSISTIPDEDDRLKILVWRETRSASKSMRMRYLFFVPEGAGAYSRDPIDGEGGYLSLPNYQIDSIRREIAPIPTRPAWHPSIAYRSDPDDLAD